MKLFFFCVYDHKSGIYAKQPFFDTSAVNAIRGFEQAVNTQHESNHLHHYPDDFHLHQLGSFDPQTGELQFDKNDLGSARTVLKKQLSPVSEIRNTTNPHADM